MTPAPRASTAMIILGMLAFGALVATGALALFVLRYPAASTVTQLVTPDAGIVITAVATVGRVSSSVPLPTQTPTVITQPTALASLGVQTAPDPSVGAPISVQAAASSIIPGPLVDPSLSLFTGPVYVPLGIQIPALKINAPVLGVGLTRTNMMATPIGTQLDDPIWQTVFWYRGGAIPGDVGTATFAGHFDDDLGRPAVFAYLGNLRTGDLILVHDGRSGVNVPFTVTETETYTDQQAADPAVEARIFGLQSSSGTETRPVSDQLAHLTLITCAGAWIDGSFNQRLVVYATRTSYPSGLGE